MTSTLNSRHGRQRPSHVFAFLIILATLLLFSGWTAAQEAVDPRTGGLVLSVSDLQVPAGAVTLEVRRTLVDPGGEQGLLGAQWRLNLESRLAPDGPGWVLREGALRIPFAVSVNSGEYRSPGGDRLVPGDEGEAILFRADGSSDRFDARGRLVERNLRNGNLLGFTYDGDRLVKVGGPYRSHLRLVYDDAGQLARVEGSNGVSADYEHSSEGLTNAKDASGWVTSYAYDGTGSLVRLDDSFPGAVEIYRDPEGRVTGRRWAEDRVERYEYDVGNLTVRHIDADGAVTVRRWNPDFSKEEITDALGRETTLEYDKLGRVIAATGPTGTKSGFTYDGLGRTVSAVDPSGQETTTEYLGDTWLPVEIRCCAGFRQSFEYDDALNLVAMKLGGAVIARFGYRPDGLVERQFNAGTGEKRMAYDANGRLTEVTDALGHRNRYEYDAVGNLVKAVNPLGGTTLLEYDSNNRLIGRTGPGGGTTRYEYNDAGQVIGITDALGRRSVLEYDARGNHVATAGPDGRKARYAVNHQGREITVIRADGLQVSSRYDALGQLISATDALQRTTRYEYDPLGRVSKLNLPAGRYLEYGYDAAGRLESITDSSSGKTTYQRDTRGEVTAVIYANGAIWRYAYDEQGSVSSVTDPTGKSTQFSHAAGGLLTGVAMPSGAETTYERDALGRVSVIRHPGREPVQLRYDAMGNLVSINDPNTEFGYDESGRLASVTDGAGRSTRYRHDALGRLVGKDKFSGQSVSYEYGRTGELLAVNDPDFPVAYNYDEQGRLAGTSYPAIDAAIRHAYDARGLRTRLIAAGGQELGYAYTALGALQAITLPDGEKIELTYGQAGRLETIRYPNGIIGAMEFDAAGRFQNIAYRETSGATLAGWTYRYDKSYNPVLVERSKGPARSYTYDADGRLTTEAGLPLPVSYSYTEAGNRAGRQLADEHTSYEYDTNGWLSVAGPESFTHDSNGNIVSRTAPWGETFYEFDYENRLISAISTDGAMVSFGYGPTGERVWREDEDGRTWFVHDGLNLLQELDSEGKPRTLYVHGPGIDRPLAMIHDGATYFYHADAAGNVAFMTDMRGAIVARYETDAFGDVIDATAEVPNPFIFSGREYDPSLRLYYFRARYYDPSLGQFLSPDPLQPVVGDPATLNRYAYARSSPVRFNDPLGLYDQETLWWAWKNANRGAVFGESNLTPEQIETKRLAEKVIYGNDALNTREQLAGRPVKRPSIDQRVWRNMPELPSTGRTGEFEVFTPESTPSGRPGGSGTGNSGYRLSAASRSMRGIPMSEALAPPDPLPTQSYSIPGGRPVSASGARPPSFSGPVGPSNYNAPEIVAPRPSPIPAHAKAEVIRPNTLRGRMMKAYGNTQVGRLGAGGYAAGGLMAVRPYIECHMSGGSRSECAWYTAKSLGKGLVFGLVVAGGGALAATGVGAPAGAGAILATATLLGYAGGTDIKNMATTGIQALQSHQQAGQLQQISEIDARINGQLSKLDGELSKLRQARALVHSQLAEMFSVQNRIGALAEKAESLPVDKETGTAGQGQATPVSIEMTQQACGNVVESLESLKLADTTVAEMSRAIAERIDTAGEAPESIAKLDAALTEIGDVAEIVAAADELKVSLVENLAVWSAYHDQIAALQNPADAPGQEPTARQIARMRADAAKYGEDAQHIQTFLQGSIAAFNNLKTATRIGITRLRDIVPDSHANRKQLFDNREIELDGIELRREATNVPGEVAKVQAAVDRVNKALGEQKSPVWTPTPDFAVARPCGDGFDAGQLVTETNDVVKSLEASLLAIMFVYDSRVSNNQITLTKIDKLIMLHQSNIRVARGKLKFLAPLIAEREQRADNRSRQQLADLQQQKAEVETMLADSERLLVQAEQMKVDNEKENTQLKERGAPVIQQVRRQAESLNQITLGGVTSGGTG